MKLEIKIDEEFESFEELQKAIKDIANRLANEYLAWASISLSYYQERGKIG